MPDEQQVVLVETGETLYHLVTRREYIETLDRLLDSIDLEIGVVNRLGKIIVWNRAVAKIWGAREQAIGQDVRDLMPPLNEFYRGYQLGEAILDDVVGLGRTIDISRYPARRPSGALAIYDFKAYPLRGRGNEILGAVLVMRDVSETIQLEQQLIRHARTTSLARLGASIAHEIRNPLNSIQLNIELLREGLDAERIDRNGLQATAALVLEEARRLNGLVTHFMEFARPAEPNFQVASPAEAIEIALRLLAEEAKRKQIEVVCQLPPLPPLRHDRGQIQQVVYNVALNAIQLMEPGGSLHVEAWVHPAHVLIRVQDTGPGIAPEAFERLFDLFFSSREGGTGLGLAIANRIVENHGGKMTAENVEGGGAAFSIYLPLSTETATT
jgi:PAS domain S-box-containing protein